VEVPTEATVTVVVPMVEMHTVTMVMHIQKALVLQTVDSITEMELTVALAVQAVMAVQVALAVVAETPSSSSSK
jgi:hypothetical protein